MGDISRSPASASDTWDFEAMDADTFTELMGVLLAHPNYEVRPVVETKHDDSAVIKTIDTQADAESTLANFRYLVMFKEEPFADLTDEQVDLLKMFEFARDSRKEVREAWEADQEDGMWEVLKSLFDRLV